MKKLIGILLLLLLFVPMAQAQESEDYFIYLPIIFKDGSEATLPWCEDYPFMSDWKVIVPESTINYCINPSGEIAGNFAAVGGGAAAVTRVTTYQRYGIYSYRVQSAANDEGGSWTLSTLSNAIHYVTVRVRGTLPTTWDWSLDNATYNEPTLLENLDANWDLYGFEFPAAQANGSTTLYIRQNGAGAGDYFIDGIQVEQKEDYYTTYCDGDQEGCAWIGMAHGSYSTRSAVSRAGGRERDLEDDYYLNIGGVIGMGSPPQSVTMDEYAILPGGELNAVKIHPRVLTLTGVLNATSESNLDDIRQDLIQILAPYSYPKDEFGWQPVRLIYTGAAQKRQMKVTYEGGLEGNRQATEPCYWENVAVRFISQGSPFWEQAENCQAAAILDTNDSATFRVVAARLKATGQWDDLGPPNAAGTYNAVYALAEDETYFYVGGSFLNFDNVANADNIVRYNKQTGVWSAMSTGANSTVWALKMGADGRLYVGGQFNVIGGGAANYIAVWDPDTETFAALGAGMDTTVYSLAIGLDGTLYAGGDFTTAGGGAALRVAAWDGAAWAALGAGADDIVWDLAIGLDGLLYAGGEFLNIGGGAANRVAVWDGSAWDTLSTGMNNEVYTLAIGIDGRLYAGGLFTTAGGVTVNYIAVWNGTTWAALGSGMDDVVNDISIGPDNILYAGGIFHTAGGIYLANRAARWNGASWSHLDINVGAATTRVIYASKYTDPVIKANYDIFVNFLIGATVYFAGTATTTNDGVEAVYPVIVFERDGGTTATIETVRNERTGKILLFDYDLLDGEKLTINLDPAEKSIVSSMFGDRLDAILANSNFGDFTLEPGDNQITSFVNVTGAPTVTAYLLWTNKYK